MKANTVAQTEIILEDEDYKALDNAIGLIKDIRDQMDVMEHSYCVVQGEEWTKRSLTCLIEDLRMIYEGKITLK